MNPREPGALELHCRRCGVQIAGESIDLASAVARCHRCHAVFGFADALSEDKPAPPSMNMPLPKGLTIFEHGDTLQLVRRWSGRGNRKIRVSELQQLFCKAHVKRKSSTTHSLNAVLGNGRTLRLLEDLSEAKQVPFLEHALEKHLGIVNQPVPGALRR